MEEIPIPYATPSSPKIYVGVNSDITVVHNDNKIVVHKNNHDDDLFDFPPGFRFCPFDEELIRCYLKRKVMNQILPLNKIHEVNLYKYSPQELSVMYPTVGEKEWYFFTPRDRKYRNGARPNRAAGNGFWKATGADKPIKDKDRIIVGLRKALVYYEGRPPKGDKTNWIMHEYRVKEAPPPKSRGGVNDMRLDDWVLCRIYNKVDKSEKSAQKKTELLKSAQAASPLAQPTPTHDDNLSVTNSSGYDQQSIGIGIQNETQFSFLSNHEMQPFHHHPCMEYNVTPNVNQPFISCGPLYSDPGSLFVTKYDDPFQEYMLSMDSITDMDHILSTPRSDV